MWNSDIENDIFVRHWIDNKKINFRKQEWFPDDFWLRLIASSPIQGDRKVKNPIFNVNKNS